MIKVSRMLSSKPKQQQQQDKTTTPMFPTVCEGCVGSLMSPAITTEDAGDRAYDFLYLSEKTRMSNHLQI